MTKSLSVLILTLFLALPVEAQQTVQARDQNIKTNNQEVLQVLKEFRSAIINNDKERASELLSPEARILESGGRETKEEYLSHHFSADSKFLKAMERQLVSQEINATQNSAWVSTVSRLNGSFNAHDINMDSAELAILVKKNDRWRIAAIHWSSRSRDS